jgi:hypothetical protein
MQIKARIRDAATIFKDGWHLSLIPLVRRGVERIGILKAVYSATRGLSPIATGPPSHRRDRKSMIVAGMWVQASALLLTRQPVIDLVAAWRRTAGPRLCHGLSQPDCGGSAASNPA